MAPLKIIPFNFNSAPYMKTAVQQARMESWISNYISPYYVGCECIYIPYIPGALLLAKISWTIIGTRPWISDYFYIKEWAVVLFINALTALEVRAWMNNYIPNKTMVVITYPSLNLSKCMIVNEDLACLCKSSYMPYGHLCIQLSLYIANISIISFVVEVAFGAHI